MSAVSVCRVCLSVLFVVSGSVCRVPLSVCLSSLLSLAVSAVSLSVPLPVPLSVLFVVSGSVCRVPLSVIQPESEMYEASPSLSLLCSSYTFSSHFLFPPSQSHSLSTSHHTHTHTNTHARTHRNRGPLLEIHTTQSTKRPERPVQVC